MLVLFAYFAPPQLGSGSTRSGASCWCCRPYSGAYLAEVFRAGLLSIPRGSTEAGLAIGLTPTQIRATIIAPLMLRNVLPSLSSTIISLFKDTSLAAVIAVPELTFAARKINVESPRHRDLDRHVRALCRLLLPHRRRAAPDRAPPGAAQVNPMSQTFLEQLWAARQVILNGLAVSVSISLLAIAAAPSWACWPAWR